MRKKNAFVYVATLFILFLLLLGASMKALSPQEVKPNERPPRVPVPAKDTMTPDLQQMKNDMREIKAILDKAEKNPVFNEK